ncbi:MAG: AAA family ATPase, partial [bacterium]|nr:AAA family ATPase [bacterium]
MNSQFTPREIVSELDRFIIGQDKAKRAVAIALRNRWRRQQVPEELRDEIAPKNIIMIGPTGVGKTEIARRLAKLAHSPFIKVEASKFTEVGYVGKDVESMIRELMDLSVKMVQEEERERVQVRAQELAEEKLLDILYESSKPSLDPTQSVLASLGTMNPSTPRLVPEPPKREGEKEPREKLRKLLRSGKLDDRAVEMETKSSPIHMVEVLAPGGMGGIPGMEEMGSSLKEMFNNIMPKSRKKKKIKVPEALKLLIQEEMSRLIDMEAVIKKAVERTEQTGIVFLDEIDKVASREGAG